MTINKLYLALLDASTGDATDPSGQDDTTNTDNADIAKDNPDQESNDENDKENKDESPDDDQKDDTLEPEASSAKNGSDADLTPETPSEGDVVASDLEKKIPPTDEDARIKNKSYEAAKNMADAIREALSTQSAELQRIFDRCDELNRDTMKIWPQIQALNELNLQGARQCVGVAALRTLRPWYTKYETAYEGAKPTRLVMQSLGEYTNGESHASYKPTLKYANDLITTMQYEVNVALDSIKEKLPAITKSLEDRLYGPTENIKQAIKRLARLRDNPYLVTNLDKAKLIVSLKGDSEQGLWNGLPMAVENEDGQLVYTFNKSIFDALIANIDTTEAAIDAYAQWAETGEGTDIVQTLKNAGFEEVAAEEFNKLAKESNLPYVASEDSTSAYFSKPLPDNNFCVINLPAEPTPETIDEVFFMSVPTKAGLNYRTVSLTEGFSSVQDILDVALVLEKRLDDFSSLIGKMVRIGDRVDEHQECVKSHEYDKAVKLFEAQKSAIMLPLSYLFAVADFYRSVSWGIDETIKLITEKGTDKKRSIE